MKLDENKAEPLYTQLENLLKAKLENGDWQKGDKLPTEMELSEKFKVSRITVRKALGSLVQQGLIVKRSGKGTFVSNEKIQRPLSGGAISFTSLCEAQGLIPGAKTIKSVLEPPTPKDREVLGLTENDRVISIERIRSADGTPVSVEVSHFTEDLSFLLDEDLTNASMYKLMKDKYHIAFDSNRKILELTYATYELARYLNVSNNHPLILISSELSLPKGKKIGFNQQYILGDRFQMII
jgi:GntR family transcriptional regulator